MDRENERPEKIVIDLEDLTEEREPAQSQNRIVVDNLSEPASGAQNYNQAGGGGFCTACGSRLTANSRFCSSCGKTMGQNGAQRPGGSQARNAGPAGNASAYRQASRTRVGGPYGAPPRQPAAGTTQVDGLMASEWSQYFLPAFYIISALSLFLPFVDFYLASWTGFNLAFGVDLGFGVRSQGHWAGVLLVLVIAACLVLSFVKFAGKTKIMLPLTGVGLLVLLVLFFEVTSEIGSSAIGIGFIVLFIALLLAGLVNAYQLTRGAGS